MSEVNLNPGPIFEPRPGWGGQLKTWLKKHWLNRLVPILAVILLIVLFAKLKGPSQPVADSSQTASPAITAPAISESVARGDSLTTLTRRALAEYLQLSPGIELKPEQKLYIENYFVAKLKGTKLTVGDTVNFSVSDLEVAVHEALTLSESRLAKLRQYLR